MKRLPRVRVAWFWPALPPIPRLISVLEQVRRAHNALRRGR